MLASMGTVGDCYDNAMMESFWGTMQLELLDWIRDQMRFPGIEKLKEQIARDVVQTSALRDRDPSRAIAKVWSARRGLAT